MDSVFKILLVCNQMNKIMTVKYMSNGK